MVAGRQHDTSQTLDTIRGTPNIESHTSSQHTEEKLSPPHCAYAVAQAPGDVIREVVVVDLVVVVAVVVVDVVVIGGNVQPSHGVMVTSARFQNSSGYRPGAVHGDKLDTSVSHSGYSLLWLERNSLYPTRN